MVYAIIDAVSDIEELISVAYADYPYELAVWFSDEVRDTSDMYLSEESDFEEVDKTLASLEVLHNEDVCELSDLEGLTVGAADISISILGAYDNYTDMKCALESFLADKPKFKKIAVPSNPDENPEILDRLNRLLIKSGI